MFTSSLARRILPVALLIGVQMAGSPLVVASASQQREAADLLYRLAQEHRQSGQLAEAIRELHEALTLDPAHEQAREALTRLERTAASKRQRAIDDVLSQVAQTRANGRAPSATAPVAVDVASPFPAGPPVRVPDARVNGTQWLYVFGRQGNADYGALREPQRVFIDVPRAEAGPVSVRVLDADTRGRHDEIDGGRNTSTVFRVLSGGHLLDALTVAPEARDGSTLTFGPYAANQGEPRGDQSRFCLEAEGLDGNDNNLFALEVTPPSAQCFSPQPSIRLAEEPGARMEFFPEVPEGASRVLVEQNYDLDPDGGRIEVIPTTKDGKRLKGVPVASSDSGAWSKTEVPVPAGTNGSRWTYRITKATQRKGNMSFRMADEQGRALPIYFTPGRFRGARRALPAEAPGACNAFVFDASESYDPDRGALSYFWEFGDGSSAEGVRVEHTYAAGGTYRVRLRVKDNSTTACCVSEVEQALPVNLPPKAALDAPEKVCAGATVHLSAAKSTDTLGETLRYRWDFGDGMAGEGVEADHVYATGGAYQVSLTVDDGRGTPCSTAQAAAVVRVNSPPAVKVNDPIRACAMKPIGPMETAFSAAGSRDPDGDPLTFTWDFGDGTRGVGERVSHVYQRGGRYTALVTADDGSGASCSTATGIVPVFLNHPPVAVADLPSTGCPNSLVTLNATKSSDSDGQPLSYQWQLGDGRSAEGATVQHAYPASGSFRARLTVSDGSGMSCDASTDEVPIVINAPPVARMTIRGGRGLVLTAPAASSDLDTASPHP